MKKNIFFNLLALLLCFSCSVYVMPFPGTGSGSENGRVAQRAIADEAGPPERPSSPEREESEIAIETLPLYRDGRQKIIALRNELSLSISQLRELLENIAARENLESIYQCIENCKNHIGYFQRRLYPEVSHAIIPQAQMCPSILQFIQVLLQESRDQLDGAEQFLRAVFENECNGDVSEGITRALSCKYNARNRLTSLFSIFAQRQLRASRPMTLLVPETPLRSLFNSPAQVFFELLEGFYLTYNQPASLCDECQQFLKNPNVWCEDCKRQNRPADGEDQNHLEKFFSSDACNMLFNQYAQLAGKLDGDAALEHLNKRIGFASNENRYEDVAKLVRLLRRVCSAELNIADFIEKEVTPERFIVETLLGLLDPPQIPYASPERATRIAEGFLRAANRDDDRRGAGTVRTLGKAGVWALSWFASEEDLSDLVSNLGKKVPVSGVIEIIHNFIGRYELIRFLPTLLAVLRNHQNRVNDMLETIADTTIGYSDRCRSVDAQLEKLEYSLPAQTSRERNLGRPMSDCLRQLGQAWFSEMVRAQEVAARNVQVDNTPRSVVSRSIESSLFGAGGISSTTPPGQQRSSLAPRLVASLGTPRASVFGEGGVSPVVPRSENRTSTSRGKWAAIDAVLKAQSAQNSTMLPAEENKKDNPGSDGAATDEASSYATSSSFFEEGSVQEEDDNPYE